MKRVKYASKRRGLDFRLTSVAQKRLCLSSLLSERTGYVKSIALNAALAKIDKFASYSQAV